MSKPTAWVAGLLAVINARRVRWVQNYRMWHVAERCRPEGCDCPCGYCKHDRRHVPGGSTT